MAEAITSDAAVRKVLLGGSFYTGLAEAVAIVSGLATSLVAARVLSPRDFGLMATATLALSVLDHFSQSGFDAALVQRQDDVESYLDVAWTWQLLRGLVITLLLFAVALPMSRFYGEAVLLPLVMASALSSTIAGAANVGRIFFARKLDFRTLFFINAAQAGLKLAVFLPAVLILRNVWALVVGHLGGALLSLAISYIAHPYRPKLAFDRGKLRELLRFGKWVTMFAWIGFFITKGDDIFVSKYIGVAALGFYQLAYDISNLPTTKVTHVIGRIGLPIYARLVHDRELLRATFLKVMRATLLASALVSTAIYIAVPDIIAYVLGSKWAPVIPLVRILVAAGFVRSFVALAGPLYQANGRPELDFWMNFPRFVVTVVLIWPFCALYGLEGASWVVLLAVATCIPMWLRETRNLIALSWRRALQELLLAAGTSASLALCLLTARALVPDTALGALAGLLGGLGAWLLADLALGALTSVGVVVEIRRLLAAVRAQRSSVPA